MANRLRLSNARLADGRLVDVLVSGGVIEAVEPHGTLQVDAGAWPSFEVDGRLLTQGLRDPHLHPDKAFGLESEAGSAATLKEAIANVRAQKPNQTADMVCERTRRLLEWCLTLGTTSARVHAEVDPLLGLRSVEGVLAARDAMAGRFNLEVVAFPQEGIVREPGTLDLMREAMHLGCDVVGAISYQDPDSREHLELAAGLAFEFGKPLDVHADFGIGVERSSLELLCEVTRTFGLEGRVAAGHCTTLALMDDEQRKRTTELLAAADVAIMALPRTDLFLDGRVASLELLRAGGVRTFIGTNNVQNAFTPVGRPSLPSAAAVYALARQQGSKPVLGELAELLWTPLTPGTANTVSAGAAADLCVWPVQEPWQMVASEAEPMAVFVGGVLAHSCQPLPDSVVSPVQSASASLDLV